MVYVLFICVWVLIKFPFLFEFVFFIFIILFILFFLHSGEGGSDGGDGGSDGVLGVVPAGGIGWYSSFGDGRPSGAVGMWRGCYDIRWEG